MKKIYTNSFLLYSRLDYKDAKKFKNVIISGSWVSFCKDFDSLKKKNIHLLKYSKKGLIKNFKYLSKLYDAILKILVVKLNSEFQLNEKERYWRILIGPWLHYFLQNMFMKWSTIKNVSTGKKNIYYNKFDTNLKKIIPQNTKHFCNMIIDEHWNNHIFSQIIQMYPKKFILYKEKKKSYTFQFNDNDGKKYSVITKIIMFFSNIYKNFSKVIFYDSFIGIKNEISIQLKLLQLPFLLKVKTDDIFSSNSSPGRFSINLHPQNSFEKFLQNIFPFCFPKSLYENFFLYKNKSIKIFPKSPRIILSWVQHQTNEFFKFWVADSIKKGAKLLIAQHGGLLGMGVFNFNTYTDIKNCDYYLSWGWKNKIKKVSPVGFLIKFNKQNVKEKKKTLLIIQLFRQYPAHLRPSLLQDSNLEFFINQINLIKNLDVETQKDLVVRLPYSATSDFYKKLLVKNFPKINFDKERDVMNSMNQSKLVVVTYNSTPLLQSLFLNLPTVCVWKEETLILNKYSQSDFNKLKDAGVLLDDFWKASKLINNISKNPDEWWNEKKRQICIHRFTTKYCCNKKSINKNIAKICSKILIDKR
jgi:putative transferase (TIGR04331 family)